MSSFESKRNYFERLSSIKTIESIRPVKIEKNKDPRVKEDPSALLILKDDVLIFNTESEAYEYAIKEYECNSDNDTCPFVVKMVDVDSLEYEFKNMYIKSEN